MTSDSLDRLRHMREFASSAVDFVGGRTASEIANDPRTFFALCRALELVGEAASQTPVTLRARVLDIPWQRAISLRHRLIHGYGDIDAAVLLGGVRAHIPPLIASLDRALEGPAP